MGEHDDWYETWHTYWSYAKSGVRFLAVVAGVMGSLFWFALGMGVAEVIGIVEEIPPSSLKS